MVGHGFEGREHVRSESHRRAEWTVDGGRWVTRADLGVPLRARSEGGRCGGEDPFWERSGIMHSESPGGSQVNHASKSNQ